MSEMSIQKDAGATVVVARGDYLEKCYPDGEGTRVVLDGVSLETRAASIVGVKGPSGCGKTTLLEIMAGLVRPDAGVVMFDGVRWDYGKYQSIARTRRDRIGLVFQEHHLLLDESIFDNVALPLRFGRPRSHRQERRETVENAISRAALEVHPKRRVRTLSGGERQRVAIARALVKDPCLLITDEPTAALDAETGQRIVSLLREVAAGGTAVLVATHDPAVAGACDTVYVFHGPHLEKMA
jgi:putative ABC transport system ATP-binding protein